MTKFYKFCIIFLKENDDGAKKVIKSCHGFIEMLATTIEEKRMERVTGHPVYSSSYSPASLQLGDSYKRRVIYKDCTSRGRKWWAPARSTYIRRVIHPVVQFPPPLTLRVFGYSINPCQWERNHLQPFFEQQPPFYQVGATKDEWDWKRKREKDE